MPELPEVERARALVEKKAGGRVIASVDDSDSYVCRPHSPGEIDDALRGRTVTGAGRVGKSFWIETDGRDCPELGLHLGMAGRIIVAGEGAGHPKPLRNPAWDRLTIAFADGGALVMRDKRRLSRAVLNPDRSSLGPDAERITREQFRRLVGSGRAPVKARLMDQSKVAGVGNLLADETLWQAGISPLHPAGDLEAAELDHLRRELRAATRRAHRLGGVHKGEVIRYRRRGASCPHCATAMERGKVGGRTTWWCPSCQP
ncbi:MAG: Fpg/Nei family DNA glycosylase [Solirubrobacterales bacterium]